MKTFASGLALALALNGLAATAAAQDAQATEIVWLSQLGGISG